MAPVLMESTTTPVYVHASSMEGIVRLGVLTIILVFKLKEKIPLKLLPNVQHSKKI